jgi:hypothetical protein
MQLWDRYDDNNLKGKTEKKTGYINNNHNVTYVQIKEKSQLVSLDFSLTKSFRSHHGPGVESASNRNEYWEYFPGGKIGRGVRLTTLPPPCAVVTKSGKLNFLRTLWGCPGL